MLCFQSLSLCYNNNADPFLDKSKSAEDILRRRFAKLGLEIDAFSSIKYIGQQTLNNVIYYLPLRFAIGTELSNTTVRSARKPCLVYNMLNMLNDQFDSGTENLSSILFSDHYFTCPVKCLSCGTRCKNNMGHIREGKPHNTNSRFVLLDSNFVFYI